ncbi:MAG: Gfo/Idh/MocA family oxidoreductase [Planctomycetia bacterium]|nr:Gfo/Idh/MocA family oxidoreductase [Planctomycetia bacterium]
MTRVRVALTGCGKVGHIHATAVRSLAEAELVGVCDVSAERARDFGAKYDVPGFTDLATMLRQAQVELLLVCTPHPLHAQPTLVAASLGVHVLVEKPLAASLADCDAMLQAAQQGGVLLGVISQRRFYEAVRRIKDAIDAGKLGKPVLGVFTMYSWRDAAYYQSDPWRGKWSTEGGGVLVNQSPHMLDLLRWYMGPIAEITGYWANVNHPGIEVDDTAVAVLRFQNGGLGSIVASVSQKPGIFTKVHIHGSNAASVGVETDRGATFIAGMTAIAEPPLNDLWTIPGEEAQLAQFQAADRQSFRQVDATSHYHALQIQDFARAIRENRAPQVTGEDGRAVVEMFTAIYRSNNERRPVTLPLKAE